LGSTAVGGYGYCHTACGKVPAHRFAYTLLKGPIPDELVIDHLCMNKGCVNPLHLEPVSQSTNIQRYWNSVKREEMIGKMERAGKLMGVPNNIVRL
jgi:hypothetical protein